tara:strand:- start:220 stop:480 length:261 start_codon:yes stop_codon:yes gene_type:complete
MKKLSCLILILLAFNVSAEKITYDQWLDKEIKAFSVQDRVFEEHQSSSWSLKKVKLRIRPLIAVEVPYLASLEIKPFVEFHWKAKK